MIACEKDTNIKKLLNGKCDIIADDFLSVSSEQISHVDYIVMNPPFSEGAKHILHALKLHLQDVQLLRCAIVVVLIKAGNMMLLKKSS